ncbi:FAD-dependent oxidoreductase [Psychromarinibacter sp. C21-152]|uniref:FAD-dependent oxidoreductase n=1 Tax=Psychromarinibacter sediminicola TaxID=3033385 RepID=A0AAE3NQJ5_9RHOB|nr:FAD-dependent oxidoreductase [Psychromarinibacter sediminicola]MDF0600251.1 FAD-dependent oxidoreductase [Psychromarinibacter sediminicola]
MRVCIIGAGIIGVTTAFAAARRGVAVTVVDRKGVAAGASFGNAGAFAFSDVIPLATPGIMRRAPAWFLDPKGPLSIPPSYALRIAPWLWRFWRASRPDRYRAAVSAQAALMDLSGAALERLIAEASLEDRLRREGQLQVYEGERAFRAAEPGLAERRAAGIRFDVLDRPEAIAEIQPGIAPRFTHAVHTPDWINVSDPADWTHAVAEAARGAGAVFETAEIRAIRPKEEGAAIVTETGERSFDRVVVAAGAWSERLTRTFGLSLPLDTERGYNTTLPAGAFDLKTHVTFADHGFVVSRVKQGLRIGGAVELGGLDLAPRMSRARVMLDKATRFLPGLDPSGGTEWMGFRPSMPDSLPVIGNAPGVPGVILAFGHGHLGLTQSAGTAEMVADMLDGAAPAIDPAPYAPTRFTGARAA